MLLSSCGRILRHQPPVLLREFGCGISSHQTVLKSVQHTSLQYDRLAANPGRAASGACNATLTRTMASEQPSAHLRKHMRNLPSILYCPLFARSLRRLLRAGPAAKPTAACPRGSAAARTCHRADRGTNVCRQVHGVVAACEAPGGKEAASATLLCARRDCAQERWKVCMSSAAFIMHSHAGTSFHVPYAGCRP